MDATLLKSDAFWSEEKPVAITAAGVEAPALNEVPPLIFFRTSGSTGGPKWLGLSREALLLSARVVNAHLEVDEASVWGLALPIHHVGGYGVIARAHQANCGFSAFGKAWQVHDYLSWLESAGVTHTSLVPAQVHDLVVAGLHAPEALRAVVVGGGELAEDIGSAARKLGWPVLASYGMTEAGSQVATQGFDCLQQPFIKAPIETLGHWQLRLEDDGCLAIAGKSLFDGQLVQEGKDWHYQPREGEWFVTRDRVKLGDAGITPLGRDDLRVKVLGELVDIGAIEERLLELSGRRLKRRGFVVAAVPDARAEHALVPVFDAAVDPEAIREILVAYDEEASGLERLQKHVTLYPLPCSELGKPQRGRVLELLAEL